MPGFFFYLGKWSKVHNKVWHHTTLCTIWNTALSNRRRSRPKLNFNPKPGSRKKNFKKSLKILFCYEIALYLKKLNCFFILLNKIVCFFNVTSFPELVFILYTILCDVILLSTFLCLPEKIQGAYNKFPDFFCMGTFIDSTHMKL